MIRKQQRQRREQIATALAQRKSVLKQRRDKIANDQAFIDAAAQMQTDYGVDVIGEMVAGVNDSVDLIEWIEDYLNLNIGDNKPAS